MGKTALRARDAQHGFEGTETMKILAISGSLRTASVNTAFLRTAATLTPYGVALVLYDGLGNLPHFNPELDKEPFPLAVADFRSQLNSSAGVVISSPEYAHGIPGVLKNALDWLVASGDLYEKPVALFNTSPRSSYAQASLAETLTVMMARLVPEAFINVSPLSGMGNGKLCVTSSMNVSARIECALATLVRAIDLTYAEAMREPNYEPMVTSLGDATTAEVALGKAARENVADPSKEI